MTKVMVLKEKAERSWILQEIWQWRYKFFICFFGAFLGIYIEQYMYIAVLNFVGYYIGIETMGYIRNRKSLDMYMSLPCNMRRTLLRKIAVSVILSLVAFLIAIAICNRVIEVSEYVCEYYSKLFNTRFSKEIEGKTAYNIYLFFRTSVFYFSFTCGVVGSLLTSYISSAICFSVFIKASIGPIVLYSIGFMTDVLENNIYQFIDAFRFLGTMLMGDFAILFSFVGAHFSEINLYYSFYIILSTLNILVAYCLIGMVKAERSGRVLLNRNFAKILLYYFTLLCGGIGCVLDSEGIIVLKIITVTLCLSIGYYFMRFILRKDLGMKGIPWFLIFSIIFTAIIAALSYNFKWGFI